MTDKVDFELMDRLIKDNNAHIKALREEQREGERIEEHRDTLDQPGRGRNRETATVRGRFQCAGRRLPPGFPFASWWVWSMAPHGGAGQSSTYPSAFNRSVSSAVGSGAMGALYRGLVKMCVSRIWERVERSAGLSSG